MRENNIKEIGRLQYFYCSPSSNLPIRDVLNERKQGKKKEPHIEIGAENYWRDCYQNSIKSSIQNKEKYLFLFTTFNNEKVIVGYIEKQYFGKRADGGFFIKGKTFLFNFEDAMPLSKMDYSKYTRVKLINEKDTQILLNHFKNKKNIILDCIEEIKKLDVNNDTCLRIHKNLKCQFEKDCLRWKNEDHS